MSPFAKKALAVTLTAAVLAGAFFLAYHFTLNEPTTVKDETEATVAATTAKQSSAAVSTTKPPQTAAPAKTTAPRTTVPQTTAPPPTTVPATTAPEETVVQTVTEVVTYIRTERYTGAEGYEYLAGYDFRRVRSEYPAAVAQHGYVIAFTSDFGGEHCEYILTYVQYQIVSNYSVTTLHNMTTGETITDPAAYYDMMAERYWGGQHINYMNQSRYILTLEGWAMDGILGVMETGENTGNGVYVDADYLNL